MRKQVLVVAALLQACGANTAPERPDLAPSIDAAPIRQDLAPSSPDLLSSGGSCASGVPGSLADTCAAQHRGCVSDASGAHCGACLQDSSGCWIGPDSAMDGACRAPMTCASLTCGPGSTCNQPDPCVDAVCSCDSNHVADASGNCQLIASSQTCDSENRTFVPVGMVGYCGDCQMGMQENLGQCVWPSCDVSMQGSLGAQCKALGRACVDGMPGSCGGCLALDGNQMPDPTTNACPSATTGCSQRSDCVEPWTYCTQLKPNDPPACHPRLCPSGQTWRRDIGACADCSQCQNGEWPVTDHDGKCYCKVDDPGSFFSGQDGKTEQCDADNDGWLKKELGDELRWATDVSVNATGVGIFDYTSLMNVRCPLVAFSKVVLHNEWGQTYSPSWTELGISGAPPLIAMYESTPNDTGSNTAIQALHLPPAAVNSLTKACAQAGASTDSVDLNGNGFGDVDESQTETTWSNTNAWAKNYQGLTNFIELYHVRFEAASPSPSPVPIQPCATCTSIVTTLPVWTGTLVIDEESRCDAKVPFSMAYVESDNYWKSCTRRRDGSFDASNPVGYDFAKYDCGGSGACTYSWPSPWPSSSNPQYTPPPPFATPPTGALPPHGPCDPGVDPGPWRGMTHYSQFMCAHVVSTMPTTTISTHNYVLTSDIGMTSTSDWEQEACQYTTSAPASNVFGPSPQQAFFQCTASVAQTQGISWVARRYLDTNGTYQGGCIDEQVEWSAMCPASTGEAVDVGFGRLVCGPQCSKNEAFYSGNGTFICGHPTASATAPGAGAAFTYTTDGGTTIQVTGEIQAGGGDGTPLQSAGCADGGTGSCITVQ